jgi:hypothetical protein
MLNSEEASRAPLYDAPFEHPDFDPLTKIGRSKTARDAIGKTRTEVLRARLTDRFPLGRWGTRPRSSWPVGSLRRTARDVVDGHR